MAEKGRSMDQGPRTSQEDTHLLPKVPICDKRLRSPFHCLTTCLVLCLLPSNMQ